MIRFSLWAGAALALVLLATSSAQAQFGRGFRIPATVQNIMLMRSPEVQKELTLSEDQAKAIGTIATEMQSTAMEIISGLQDLTAEEREEEMPNVMEMVTEEAKALQDRVDEILDGEQTARMKELSLQARGMEALADEETIAALKVTDEQQKQLAAVRDESADKRDEIFQAMIRGGGDRSKLREEMQALRKETGDKALAVLTTEQREAFEKMKGAKFEFPRRRGFGF